MAYKGRIVDAQLAALLHLPLEAPLAREFYAEMCRVERWSVRALRQQIDGMLYERTALSARRELLRLPPAREALPPAARGEGEPHRARQEGAPRARPDRSDAALGDAAEPGGRDGRPVQPSAARAHADVVAGGGDLRRRCVALPGRGGRGGVGGPRSGDRAGAAARGRLRAGARGRQQGAWLTGGQVLPAALSSTWASSRSGCGRQRAARARAGPWCRRRWRRPRRRGTWRGGGPWWRSSTG